MGTDSICMSKTDHKHSCKKMTAFFLPILLKLLYAFIIVEKQIFREMHVSFLVQNSKRRKYSSSLLSQIVWGEKTQRTFQMGLNVGKSVLAL